MLRTFALPAFPFPSLLNETGSREVATPGAILVVEAALPVALTPAAGSIVFSGFAPTSVINTVVSPASGSIVFTGFAPSPGASATPAAGSLVFTGKAPSIDITVPPGVGSVLFTGRVPVVVNLSGGFFHPVF